MIETFILLVIITLLFLLLAYIDKKVSVKTEKLGIILIIIFLILVASLTEQVINSIIKITP